MGVYINMEMPQASDEFVEVMIYGNGKVIKTGKSWRCKEDGNCYYESIMPENFHATEIHEPHGRLIDAKALEKDLGKRWNVNDDQDFCNKEVWHGIADAPTIIPASEKVET